MILTDQQIQYRIKLIGEKKVLGYKLPMKRRGIAINHKWKSDGANIFKCIKCGAKKEIIKSVAIYESDKKSSFKAPTCNR